MDTTKSVLCLGILIVSLLLQRCQCRRITALGLLYGLLQCVRLGLRGELGCLLRGCRGLLDCLEDALGIGIGLGKLLELLVGSPVAGIDLLGQPDDVEGDGHVESKPNMALG